MADFGKLYLDKEKDIIVELTMTGEELSYILRTPNHKTGNLISNLAGLCELPLAFDKEGLKVIRGKIPCYVDDENRQVYVLRLGDTKVANIYPDGSIERKASIPAIAKTLMSQTKDYRLDLRKTLVKTYIPREYKFRTDLHTHMNANLHPDLLIALGIHHQIRYPLYYIKKLELHCTEAQWKALEAQREEVKKSFSDSKLKGKYLTRKIDDNTFINFADLILNNIENAAYNIPRIRASLSILKDGQAVFTNLEKVYLYRYVFAKGVTSEQRIALPGLCGSSKEKGIMKSGDLSLTDNGSQAPEAGLLYDGDQAHCRDTSDKGSDLRVYDRIPDREIAAALIQMAKDREKPEYADFTLFQDKLLWIARSYQKRGILYAEISDTSLVKPIQAPKVLSEVHKAMPAIRKETGVTIRLLAGIRRIPLTIVKDQIKAQGDFAEQLRTLRAVAVDPYVAGSDIIGEEMNDIRDLAPVIRELVHIAGEVPGFVLRIHAGENDSLPDNVANSLRSVKKALSPGQKMPELRIGHGLYTANLRTARGQRLLQELRESGAVLEFQISSNVRLNNLSTMTRHPLKDYLKGGVLCVQGTDGGAIYGTDSMDEQLALERMLELSREELLSMRHAEDQVLERSLRVFAEKQLAFLEMAAGEDPLSFLAERVRTEKEKEDSLFSEETLEESEALFTEQIKELPTDKMPVVVLGGSFNSDQHKTRMRPELKELIVRLIEELDPKKAFFVIGHRMTAYEKELVQLSDGKFEIYAFVPSKMSLEEAERLKKSGVGIRVSIEPNGMGLYKSIAYEIFKRRPSIVIGLDGNSSGANTIQEAKNGKKKAKIFVSTHARILKSKAQTLEGYVQLFEGPEVMEKIVIE